MKNISMKNVSQKLCNLESRVMSKIIDIGKRKGCEFNYICKKADMFIRSDLTYWPRDKRLSPCCQAQEDPEKCIIYSYWNENPMEREFTEKKLNEIPLVILGALGTGFGISLLMSKYPHNIIGIPITLINLYIISENLSRRFKGKDIVRFLKEIKEREGIDAIYNKITAKSKQEPEIFRELLASGDFWISQMGENMAKNFSDIKDLSISVKDIQPLIIEQTRFKLGKIHVSYPLTTDLNLFNEKNIGVALSYEYEHGICEPNCPIHEGKTMKTFYTTGVLFPKVSGRRIKKGFGFIQGTHYMPPLPLPSIQKDKEDGEVKVGIKTHIAAMINVEGGLINAIFGDINKFNQMAESCMNEKTRIDARNVHRLMQDVLYSDFK